MNEDDHLVGLQERIKELQAEKESPNVPAGGRELHLMFSLGLVVVSTLAGGSWLGRYLAVRWNWPGAETATLVAAVLLAAFSAYKLFRPFLGK